jgi:hypothetical protein
MADKVGGLMYGFAPARILAPFSSGNSVYSVHSSVTYLGLVGYII